MVAIRIDTFGGEQPRVSKRLLPPNASVDARNCDLQTGELRGLRGLELLADLSATPGSVRRVYRLPGTDTFMAFASEDVDVVRGPLVNDAFDRYYWSGQGAPRYNTRQRIIDGDPSYVLGILGPASAPILTPSGGSADPETRAYVYTFVNIYGEESQPSPPVFATAPENATWTLSNLQTLPPSHTNRAPAQWKRIYRSVSGGATVTNRFVAQIPIADVSYADSQSNVVVARNDPLGSQQFAPPPADLQGLTVMANGMVVGFVGRDIYICEPYRPHAWPVEYIQSVEHDIVGLASFGQSVVVLTNSNPIVASGVNPLSVTLSKISNIEPCVSKRGIVTTEVGVFYPSDNGLILVVPGQARNITKELITREQWLTLYRPESIKAAQLGMRYIAYNSRDRGFMFGFDEPLGKVINIDWFNQVDGVETDYYNGTVYLIRNKMVYEWDSPNRPPIYYTWWSKRFTFPKPINFGALKLRMDTSQLLTPQQSLTAEQLAYNQARIQCPLDTINMHPINDIWDRCISTSYSRTDDFSTYIPFDYTDQQTLLGDIIWNLDEQEDFRLSEINGEPSISMETMEDEVSTLRARFNVTGTIRLDEIQLGNTFEVEAFVELIAFDDDNNVIADIELGFVPVNELRTFVVGINNIRTFELVYTLSAILTSPPYPIIAIESLLSGGDQRNGILWVPPLDFIISGGEYISGDLRTILIEHSQPHEDSLFSDGEYTEGDLRTILIEHSQPHEDSILSDGEYVSGTLVTILISHNQPHEDSLISSGEYTAGALT